MLRHDSHMTFVHGMGSRLAWRENQMGLMQDALLTTEIEIALARERLSAEKGRVAALQDDNAAAATDLASARADLLAAQDALAVSESAGVAARAEIIAWEESRGEHGRADPAAPPRLTARSAEAIRSRALETPWGIMVVDTPRDSWGCR